MSKFKPFSVTVPGGNHIKEDINCQDSSFSIDTGNVSIAVVADGHGDRNCFRSDKGSKFAVSCAVKGIADFTKIHESRFNAGIIKKKEITSKKEFEKKIRDLTKHIIASWQIKVEEDYSTNPLTAEEFEKTDEKYRIRYEAGKGLSKVYGTTLIASAITENYWFGIHIGDGRLTAMYPDGSFDQPVPWDEKCYLNVTTSICDDNALEQARIYFSYNDVKTSPIAVFLCTDGIDDNYPVEGNEKYLFKLYRTIALTFVKDGFDSTISQLKELTNAFATKGKGDDTSIAGFICMEGAKRTELIWQQQIDKEENNTAEKNTSEKENSSAKIENKNGNVVKKSTQKALEAIAAYEKNNVKENILNYGGFVSGKREV